jgi:dihydroflavonol-4-reductase
MTLTAGRSVLVTGASGFIGGHLVRALIARGCGVSCLARSASHVDALRALGAQIIAGDITNRAEVARAISSSSASFVFHLAGLVRAIGPGDYSRVNIGGVEAVAQACSEQADRPVLVLVSSLAAAGPSGQRPTMETDTPLPVSNYGQSKLAGEQVAMRYADSLAITVVRPCVVFGAGDRGMYEVFRPIARTGLHVVGASGDTRLSLVAVPDLVDCLLRAAEQGERLIPDVLGHGVYFAAAEDVSYAELGTAIARALSKPRPHMVRLPGWSMRTIGWFGDVTVQIRRRPAWLGSDKIREVLAGSWTCSAAKARQQLGWAPAAPLAQRLHETVQWYRDAQWF